MMNERNHEPKCLQSVLVNLAVCTSVPRHAIPPAVRLVFRSMVEAGWAPVPFRCGTGRLILSIVDGTMSGNIWGGDVRLCTFVLATDALSQRELWQFILDIQSEDEGPDGSLRELSDEQTMPATLPWLAFHVDHTLLDFSNLRLLLQLQQDL